MQYQYSYQCQRSDGRYVNTLFTKGDPSAGYNTGLGGHVTSANVSKWSSMKGLHLFDNSFSGWLDEEIGKLKYLGELCKKLMCCLCIVVLCSLELVSPCF